MAFRTYNGTAPAVAQESNYTVSDITLANTYIFTFTDLNTNATQAVTYAVAAGDTTTTLLAASIAAALVAAAATKPLIQALTVTSSGAVVNIKASTAGAPWSLAITGTATTPTAVVVKANSGPYDFNCAGNYAEGIVPTTNDHITFFGMCLYSLYQSGTTFGKITLARGPNGAPTAGNISTPPFKMTCTQLDVEDGTFNIDVNASAITCNIYKTATAGASGAITGNLSGSGITAINQYGGAVGYSPFAGDADTETTLNIFDGTFLVGSGATLTTMNLLGGSGEIKCALTTLNALAGDLIINGVGAITTVNHTDANVISNTSGTIGTWTRKGAGVADFTKSRVARTISTAVWGGNKGGVFYDSTILTRSSESFPTTGAAIDGPVAAEGP